MNLMYISQIIKNYSNHLVWRRSNCRSNYTYNSAFYPERKKRENEKFKNLILHPPPGPSKISNVRFVGVRPVGEVNFNKRLMKKKRPSMN